MENSLMKLVRTDSTHGEPPRDRAASALAERSLAAEPALVSGAFLLTASEMVDRRWVEMASSTKIDRTSPDPLGRRARRGYLQEP